MAITKNPLYFLWVGALGRLAARHRGFVAGLCVAFGATAFFWFFARPQSAPPVQIVRQYLPQPVAPRREWGLEVAPTSPCDSREVAYTFEARKPDRPFNNLGQCGPVLWFKGHCIWGLGYKSNTPVKLCDKPGIPHTEFPQGLEYAWSADGYAFQDKYRLDPPRYTSTLQ
jgi:hypothetical protein